MKTIYQKGIELVLFLLMAGCANGVLFNNGLYSHTVEPLSFNREPTEMLIDNKQGGGDIKHLQYIVSIEIGTNGIGDVAKKNGIETVYYADIEKRSFIFGIWRQQIIHVYGR
jgi:hypothetical protein